MGLNIVPQQSSVREILKKVEIAPEFSSTDRRRIRDTFRRLYEDDRISFVRPTLEKLVQASKPLQFRFEKDTAATNLAKFDQEGRLIPQDVRLDFTYVDSLTMLTPRGNVVKMSPDLVILHELLHSIDGKRDTPRAKPPVLLDAQIQGPVVAEVNFYRSQLGLEERIAYEGVDRQSNLPVGTQFTNNQEIDIALLSNGFLDTANINTRDLLIGVDTSAAQNQNRHVLISGGNKDFLYGRLGNDELNGGGDNDLIDGGDGRDIAVYSGQCSDYTVQQQADGSYRIRDNRTNNPDGTDTLKNIEVLKFSDGESRLENGSHICGANNVVLAVDVSGSMDDDIAAVQAAANEVVDQIFGSDDSGS